MKKFSQITESYDYDEKKFKPHPAVNKEFWDSKVQPLIDTMFAASPSLFQKYTMDNLLNLVRSINQDYVRKRKLPKEKCGGGKIDIDEWLSLNALESINNIENLVIEIDIFNPSFRWKSS